MHKFFYVICQRLEDLENGWLYKIVVWVAVFNLIAVRTFISLTLPSASAFKEISQPTTSHLRVLGDEESRERECKRERSAHASKFPKVTCYATLLTRASTPSTLLCLSAHCQLSKSLHFWQAFSFFFCCEGSANLERGKWKTIVLICFIIFVVCFCHCF